MITAEQVQKLRALRAPGPSVLSLYLQVPAVAAALRSLPERADEMVARAASAGEQRVARTHRPERRTVRRLLEVHARAWLGHTVAIFAAADVGLADAFPLPCAVAERAVLAARPHVRPLLVALQRCPAYHVVVLERQHARVFRITGTRIDAMVISATPGAPGGGFGGWYGLHRQDDRTITEIACHHFGDAAASLKQVLPASGWQPLVVGGPQDEVPAFLTLLPDDLRDRFAGGFITGPGVTTPRRVRELSAAVTGRWIERHEQRAVAQILAEPSGGLAALGLGPCLAAASSHAVRVLAVPTEGLVPGFACEVCGVLASTPAGCPHLTVTAHPVPDLLEELVAATLDDGGEVLAVPRPPAGVAAQLKFPLIPAPPRNPRCQP